VPKELEVQTQAGTWYLLRIRPYRTLENVIEGAVITFTEITEMKKAQAALRESEACAAWRW
jgi:two-component system CheB/CheR fusion protein